ncbi:hypothetical protein ACJX0J_008533, partial [Zea mays]
FGVHLNKYNCRFFLWNFIQLASLLSVVLTIGQLASLLCFVRVQAVHIIGEVQKRFSLGLSKDNYIIIFHSNDRKIIIFNAHITYLSCTHHLVNSVLLILWMMLINILWNYIVTNSAEKWKHICYNKNVALNFQNCSNAGMLPV